ncbi:MAG: hypothetical protein KME09_14710 [Pleurocapsa minor HA4230-MV1]|jgi:hypothetical protein|nr:hypothetical protein [Pleurocapsa minor HA4230-MV1]
MKIFIGICIAHFVEHLAQIYELYVLGWSRPLCLGFLGLWQPALMHSEWLHYGYALFMLIGLYQLQRQVKTRWWVTTIYLQQFHHLEHLLLLIQALGGVAMANRTSIGGAFFPRLELHFFYNLVVMIPMMIALTKNRNFTNGVSI